MSNMKYEDVREMSKLLRSIERNKRDLINDQLAATKILRSFGYPEAMSSNCETLLREAISENEERLEKEDEEQRNAIKKAAEEAKTKRLNKALDKIHAMGLKTIPRPKIDFGTTEDHTVRILAMGAENDEGYRPALIWHGGTSWSDRMGTHYGESWMDIRYVYEEKYGLKESRQIKGALNVIETGKITVKRLEEIQDTIKKFIPNYKPALVPWEYTIIYE